MTQTWNTKVGSPTYSGNAVALPLTRIPMTGCTCRVRDPTFFIGRGQARRGRDFGAKNGPPLTMAATVR